jgi:DNA-binding response OmpR family regulator
MTTKPTLLVVDDEQVVCLSCKAIFASQGFDVETVNDPREGLTLARARHFSAILLDIMMPQMTGIEFLERLREFDATVPVIIITGYASVSNAAEAMRLHASDYIPKPFTPDELRSAVSRVVAMPRERAAADPIAALAGWTPVGGYLFLDRSWRRLGADGTVLAGAFLGREEGKAVERLRLPELGDRVTEGLPLAEAQLPDGRRIVIPSPATGTVVETHAALAERPKDGAWGDPCTDAWLARIRLGAPEHELRAVPRKVLVLNGDAARADEQAVRLQRLGCEVVVAPGEAAALSSVAAARPGLVVLDGASFGDTAPGLLGRLAVAAPGLRVVVAAPSDWAHEGACRAQKVFYYAAELFADDEIVDILDSAWRPAAPPPPAPPRAGVLPDAVRVLRITNRNGRSVALLAPNGVLHEHDGVGRLVLDGIRELGVPAKITLGSEGLSTLDIWQLAKECDRGFLLMPQDSGRVPGTLVREALHTPWTPEGLAEDRIVTLVVQAAPQGAPLAFDPRTNDSLADLILDRMTSVA